MEAHQQRVVDEAKELKEKLDRLDAFMNGSGYKALSAEEQELMFAQRYHMRRYLDTLYDRMKLWGVRP